MLECLGTSGPQDVHGSPPPTPGSAHLAPSVQRQASQTSRNHPEYGHTLIVTSEHRPGKHGHRVRGQSSAPGEVGAEPASAASGPSRRARSSRRSSPGPAATSRYAAPHRGCAPDGGGAGQRPPPRDHRAWRRPSCPGKTAASPPRTRPARSPGARSPRSGSCRPCHAQRAGVLPGHTRGRRPVPAKPGVIHHQRLHRLTGRETPRHIPPHCRVIPRRRRDELLQPAAGPPPAAPPSAASICAAHRPAARAHTAHRPPAGPSAAARRASPRQRPAAGAGLPPSVEGSSRHDSTKISASAGGTPDDLTKYY